MPGLDLDWGIENTSQGQQLIDNIMDDNFLEGSPEDVTPNEEDAPAGEEEGKEKNKQPVPPKRVSKEIDLDDILGEDEPEEDESEEEEPKSKPKGNTKEPVTEEIEEEEEETEEDGTNGFSSFAQELIKLGVFPEDEDLEFPTTGEEMLQWVQANNTKQLQYGLDSYLSRFGEDRKKLFQDIFENGVEPKKYLETFVKIENFSNLDMTKESNQEKVVKAYLKNSGLEDEDVDSELERLKEYGDLEKVSEKYHKVIVKQENKKLEEEAELSKRKLQQEKEWEELYQGSINQILAEKLKQKHFDGIPVTPAVQQKVFTDLTQKNWKLPSGELLTNFDKFILDLKKPENFPLKVKLQLLINNGLDLTKVKKIQASEENEELFNTLARQKKTISKPKKAKQKEETLDAFSQWAKS